MLAREVAADERVRALDLVRDGLADVVQQRGAAGGLGRGAELVGHHRRQVGALDRVGEHVLAVAGAELQAAEEAHQLGVEAADVGVEAGLLARLDHVALELGLGLVVGLLDPRRVDAPVLQQLLERHAGDLAPHAVEAGQDHRVRRVVDDEVDAGEVLERADVAPLAADDAALHVVGGELDDRHGRLGGVAGGHPLHDDGEDVAHAAVGVALGLLLDLAHAARAVVADLVLELASAGSAWPARRSGPATRSSSRTWRSRRSLDLRPAAPRAPPRGWSSAARCWSSAASLDSRRSSRRTISVRRSLRSASARCRRATGSAAAGCAAPAAPRGPASAGARRDSSEAPATRPAASTTAAITISISFPLPWAGGAPTRAHVCFGSARPGSRHRARGTCSEGGLRPPRQMAARCVLVGGMGRGAGASGSYVGSAVT